MTTAPEVCAACGVRVLDTRLVDPASGQSTPIFACPACGAPWQGLSSVPQVSVIMGRA